jgi:hypothetical protein
VGRLKTRMRGGTGRDEGLTCCGGQVEAAPQLRRQGLPEKLEAVVLLFHGCRPWGPLLRGWETTEWSVAAPPNRGRRVRKEEANGVAVVKASRPLFHVLVINDNHCGLTFLFEL